MRSAFIASLLTAMTAAAPALDYNIRVDLDGAKIDSHFTDCSIVTGTGTTAKASWLASDKADTHICYQFATPVGTWTEVAFKATPSADGQIGLSLMGPWQRKANQETVPAEKKEIEEIRVLWDLVSAEGTTVTNGDFETAGKEAAGAPQGWWFNKGAERLTVANQAKSGSSWISTWHNGNAVQSLTVSAGKPITIKAWVQATFPATK